MKRVILTAAIILTALSGYAQQDPLISQYMFNYLLVNPAYAGSKDYAMASALYRTQWTSLDGAPTTMLASLHGPVFKSRKVGLGLTLANDNIGITNRTTVFGSYAYHIPLKNDLKLGLGVDAGIYYQKSDLQKAKPSDAGDPLYQGAGKSKITPQLGAGAYLYNDKFYIGLSVPGLLTYDGDRPLSITGKKDDPTKSIYAYVRHYWATGGVAIEASEDLVFRPSVMLRYTKNAPFQGDINLNVFIKKFLVLGATFRAGSGTDGVPESVVGIVEFIIKKQFRIGYSYDFTTSGLSSYSVGGTHEITLGYDFGYDIKKLKSPRYF